MNSVLFIAGIVVSILIGVVVVGLIAEALLALPKPRSTRARKRIPIGTRGQITLDDFPHLIMALGFGVGSIAVIGERVYVTRVIDSDALRRRCEIPPHLTVSWTEEVTGWERDAVFRALA
jgi:hypothetical protein